MHHVQVNITGKDRNVGAMVKALAVEVTGFTAVKGTTKEFLKENGHYVFHFPNGEKAEEFKNLVRKYIPENFAQVVAHVN